MRIHILVALISFIMTGIAKSDTACENPVPFDSIFLTRSTSFTQPEDLVIRTEEQWCELWARVHAGNWLPPCDRDLVDFRHEAIVFTAIGGRRNGCFDVSITCIEAIRGRGVLRVFARERAPAPYCVCTRAPTSPVHAVVVDKPVGRVEFVHEVLVPQQCGY